MLFNSSEFIFIFLPITLLVYFFLGQQKLFSLAATWLILCSLFFYSWWNPFYLVLLLFSVVINYICGRLLGQDDIQPQRRKFLLIAGIALNLFLIAYYKYLGFFVGTINEVLHLGLPIAEIALPLAISFFTFQQIAYLVDSYRLETSTYSFKQYILFVTFFPQLIAGPIVHHKEVTPQFSQGQTYQFKSENFTAGLTIFCLGLCKKVLIADGVAPYSSEMFAAASQGIEISFFQAWGGVLAYTIQLYFDFSGYSDMAIGIAKIFGINLPLNFNSPYKAISIVDFWRRWHITLSNFLRDYLYIPLGGNKKGETRRWINLMTTMLLGGLWHGAGWNFIIWGGLHGGYLTVNHQWRSVMKKAGHSLKASPWWRNRLGQILTFLVVVVAWVFFRAETVQSAWLVLKGMAGQSGVTIPLLVAKKLGPFQDVLAGLGVTFQRKGVMDFVLNYVAIALVLPIIFWMPNVPQFMGLYHWGETASETVEETASNDRPKPHLTKSDRTLSRQRPRLKWSPSIPFGFLLGTLMFIVTKTFLAAPNSEFLYFNF